MHLEIEVLKQLGLFCSAGLLVSLILMACGLDLCPGYGWSAAVPY
jgi:hypothetical protein